MATIVMPTSADAHEAIRRRSIYRHRNYDARLLGHEYERRGHFIAVVVRRLDISSRRRLRPRNGRPNTSFDFLFRAATLNIQLENAYQHESHVYQKHPASASWI